MPAWNQVSAGKKDLNKYDLAAPLDYEPESEGDLIDFGHCVAENLAIKGLCTVQLPLDGGDFERLAAEVAALDGDGKFFTPPGEIVDGLLGEEGSTRIAELNVPDGGPAQEESILVTCDKHLSLVANVLELVAPKFFGFGLGFRTSALVHESGTPWDTFPYITQARALQWFQTFTSHRIMCLIFLGPGCGILEMQLFDVESTPHEVEIEPGMCVYLRADLVSHKFRSPEEAYTLSCWLLDSEDNTSQHSNHTQSSLSMPPVARSLNTILKWPAEEDVVGEKMPWDVQCRLHHRYRTGGKTAVLGLACKLPADLCNWSVTQCLHGVDCCESVPIKRWDHEEFYDEDAANIRFGKVTCQHMSYIEGLQMFDNKRFNMSPIEASTLAHEQRQVLEVGYESMYFAGFRKDTMEGSATGVYVGARWAEWNTSSWTDSGVQGGSEGSSNMSALPASRLSYICRFIGPCISLDTEGASSLTAICRGNDNIRVTRERRTADRSLCIGVSLLVSPAVMLEHARGGRLSRTGRCWAFGAIADGYVIGEGAGAALLAPLDEVLQLQTYNDEEHPVCGLISASNVGIVAHRSALAAAPNAPADQRLLRIAIDVGGLSYLDIDGAECHGVGNFLEDPVEAESLAKVLRGGSSRSGSTDPRPHTLLLGAFKTCVANSRAAAGITGLVKTMRLQRLGFMPPCLHLHATNPHLEFNNRPIRFVLETQEFSMHSSYCIVTSKGIGGAVAHVVTWGATDAGQQSEQPEDPRPNKRMEISWWPGGGGELEDDAHPERAYMIVGSWSAWMDAEDMEEEAPGVYGYTMTLGDHCKEQFQIRLDGHPERVLHPPVPQAPGCLAVQGPNQSAARLCWLIDAQGLMSCSAQEKGDPGKDGEDVGGMGEAGSTRAGNQSDGGSIGKGRDSSGVPAFELSGSGTRDSEAAEGSHHGQENHGDAVAAPPMSRSEYPPTDREDRVRPGDQYRIRLLVHGKYRTVSWERIKNAEPGQALSFRSKYFVIASWNMWQLVQEMEPHPTIKGLFRTEVLLTRPGGEFQIIVNSDPDLVLYPAEEAVGGSLQHQVRGPDTASDTRGMNWFLDGKPGDAFRIEYQMAWDGGDFRQVVSFRRIWYQELTEEQLWEAAMTRYFVTGSWDCWTPQEMIWNEEGGYFQTQMTVGVEGREVFQILMDNDWRLRLHPTSEDSAPSHVMGPSELEQCEGICWMIGGDDENDGAPAGYRYAIRLHLIEGQPVHVDWVQRG